MIHKIILLLLLLPAIAFAHGDDDHGAGKEQGAKQLKYFSSEASTDVYELLVKYKPLKPGASSVLQLFATNFNTNAPVDTSATIAVMVSNYPNIKLKVIRVEAGIYKIEGNFPEAKDYKLVVNINSALGPDVIAIQQISVGKALPVAEEAAVDTSSAWYSNTWAVAVIGLLAGLGLMYFVLRKRMRKVTTSLLLLLCLSPLTGINTLFAHGDDDHTAGGATGGAMSTTLNIEKEAQLLYKILTQPVDSGTFNKATQVMGIVVASPQGKAVVQTPQTGKIISLRTTPGQTVSAGQVVAVIEQTIDAGTQSSIAAQNSDWKARQNEAEAQYTAAKIQYDRLLKIADIVAKKDLTEAKARLEETERNRRLYRNIPLQKVQAAKYINLVSPISGVVGNFNYAVGAIINSGETLLEITNLNRVFVEAQTFSSGNMDLKSLDKITASSTNPSDTTQYLLKLVATAQEVNANNQSQKVIFEILNPRSQFKIGESISIDVYSKDSSSQLVVPKQAVIDVNGKLAVFIKDKAEVYSLSYISKGTENANNTVVLKGIENGERIVTSGVYQLKTIYLNQ